MEVDRTAEECQGLLLSESPLISFSFPLHSTLYDYTTFSPHLNVGGHVLAASLASKKTVVALFL